MKNVILYVRVSTDEQADKGYSLRDQEAKLTQYCEERDYNIVAIYREDYSAKTFNRPEFKKLLAYCKSNKRQIDEILLIKWDRFSRNTAESYQMIATFDALDIKINSITQPLDMTIPEQLLMMAVYLAIPEVENQRRSQNVIAGMRRAFKEGRYVGAPPKGYYVGRDDAKKPILTPSNVAPLIQEGFELIAKGIYTQKEVLNRLNIKGLKSSKSMFSIILRNPIYYGGVFIKAYKDEPEVMVDGIHEPIISKKLFDQVQDVLDAKRKKHHVTHSRINPKFPLKGFLLCPECKRPLTASVCKGRSEHYSYYHCISPCKGRFRLEEADAAFMSFLKSISLKKPVLKLLQIIIKDQLKKQLQATKLGPKHYEKVTLVSNKLIKLQDLFIDGQMDKKEYSQAKKRYQDILDELQCLEENQNKQKAIFETYKKGLSNLQNFDKQYVEGDIHNKRLLTGLIFPNKFSFQNKKVQTADINPLLLKISSINKGFGTNKKRDNSFIKNLSRSVTAKGFEPPTLRAEI
ncbi:recombinase family protein [Litoribaculum gwangyangense]|uniref:Recombinase family protein n=1 Tax=Litoribaculum gwangyangense TaxID=1130722 RepID=A0ABP9CKC5_9FLAO